MKKKTITGACIAAKTVMEAYINELKSNDYRIVAKGPSGMSLYGPKATGVEVDLDEWGIPTHIVKYHTECGQCIIEYDLSFWSWIDNKDNEDYRTMFYNLIEE